MICGEKQNVSINRSELPLLQETGIDGLNARGAVAMAAARGMDVERTTFSSLLSRLKADDIVAHDGYRYRLRLHEKRPEFQSPAAHS